jgi:hypothetical protein
MAAGCKNGKEDSLSFGTNGEVFRIAECQCCSLLKNELQAFVNKLKING